MIFIRLDAPMSSWFSAEASAVTIRDGRNGRCPGLDIPAGRASPLNLPLGQQWEGTWAGPGGSLRVVLPTQKHIREVVCAGSHGSLTSAGCFGAVCPWQSW